MEGTLGEKFTTPSSWGSLPSMQSEFDLINSTDISSQNFRFNPQRIHQLSDELIYHIPKESSEKDFPSSFEDMIHNRRNGVMKSIVSLEERCSRERCETRQTNMARKVWLEEKRRYVTKQDEITKLGVSMVANKVNNLVQNDAWKGKVKKNLLDDHVNVMTKSKKDGSAILEFLQLPLDSPNYVAAWRILHILWQREAKTPMERLMATMSHLGRQFQSHVFKRVRIAMAHGQITEERKYSGISSAIAAYVYLTLGKEASYWAIIFYLLRIGDFASAKSVLVYNQANHRLLDILDAYSQHQGSLSSVWDQNSFISIHPVRKDLIGNDEFENYCIFLLSGNKEAERSFKISTTTEDFMYFSLLRVSLVSSNTVKSLIELGKEIKTLGPKYFESNNETNAWSYAMPLFLAQQYRSSILHLIKVGGDVGALEATHLGIFLPELCDLGESSSSCLLSSLLIDFARNLKPSQALAYLIHLPDNKEKRKRITELLVVSRQFEELAGTIDTNGIRREEDSVLARYFCKQEISQILEEAAIVATDIGNEKDSLELLNLAENYTSLINILNEKLSSLLLAGTHSEKE
jgi:Nup93/Nic96